MKTSFVLKIATDAWLSDTLIDGGAQFPIGANLPAGIYFHIMVLYDRDLLKLREEF